MSPSTAATFLHAAINAKLPILLTGPPGVGKSDIVAQAAEKLDCDVILSHPVVSDPTDAKGLPWPDKDAGTATFLPFGELAAALNATKDTVWFLDDLGQASPAVQASFMQLLLARRVNGHKLPDCITFVAATNRRQDRAGVQGILEPVKSRFASIIELTPDLDDWCNWASIDGRIPAELVAFMRYRPELLSQPNPTGDMQNSPSPRTWSNVARLQSLNLSTSMNHEVFKGAVGEGPAGEYCAFLGMYKSMVSIDAILNDPQGIPIPTGEPGQLYAISVGLAYKSNQNTFPSIAAYTARLVEAGRAEFGALIMRDCIRRDFTLANTAAYVKLMTDGNLAEVLQGAR